MLSKKQNPQKKIQGKLWVTVRQRQCISMDDLSCQLCFTRTHSARGWTGCVCVHRGPL